MSESLSGSATCPWQSSRGSSLLGFVRRDAERMASELSLASTARDPGHETHRRVEGAVG
jgi:hypothetical protein